MNETVTVRRLQRETSALLRAIEESGRPLVVTRDGVEIAVLAPLSPVEKAWRQHLRDAGHDPDHPRWSEGDPDIELIEPQAGEKPLSQIIDEMREERL